MEENQPESTHPPSPSRGSDDRQTIVNTPPTVNTSDFSDKLKNPPGIHSKILQLSSAKEIIREPADSPPRRAGVVLVGGGTVIRRDDDTDNVDDATTGSTVTTGSPASSAPQTEPDVQHENNMVEKHVKIHENIEIHEEGDDDATNSNQTRKLSEIDVKSRYMRKENVPAKRELIGILKPPAPGKEANSFPSLPDAFLKELGLLEEMSLSTDNLSEQDIENKFSSLSLAFKTDRVTLNDRLDLQLRQRDIAEKNVSDEIRQLKTIVKSLNRLCQDSDTREILERVGKQISILQQSTGRVASCSEQFGAVQQEMRISTVVEIMLLHLENIKRNYEREHSELEETRRMLVRHKLIDGDVCHEGTPRLRSVSVIHDSKTTENQGTRRASVATSNHANLSVGKNPNLGRSRSPTLLQMVSARNIVHTFSEDLSRKIEKKNSVFSPIAEEDNKNDSNNNSSIDNKNQELLLERRRESRRQSQFDVDTIIEEMEELAAKRNSSPTPPPSPLDLMAAPHRKLVLPTSPVEMYQRKRSLILHLQAWYSDLYWPYDEEETLLGLRYVISGILSVAAIAVLLGTFIGS